MPLLCLWLLQRARRKGNISKKPILFPRADFLDHFSTGLAVAPSVRLYAVQPQYSILVSSLLLFFHTLLFIWLLAVVFIQRSSFIITP